MSYGSMATCQCAPQISLLDLQLEIDMKHHINTKPMLISSQAFTLKNEHNWPNRHKNLCKIIEKDGMRVC